MSRVVESFPARTRMGKGLRLLAVSIVGSMLMAATSGGIYVATGVDASATPLGFGYDAVRGAYLTAWAFCAAGLGVLALLCAWRRSRGHLTWHYGRALGLAFSAMMAVWFVPAFVMGFSTHRDGGTLLGSLGLGIGMWILTGAFALFFNLLNLTLIVPAIIDAWYAVLNDGTPAQEAVGAARKRRGWLYGLTLLAIVLVACIGP